MHDPATRPTRINEQLAQYWHELRGERRLPFEHEINLEALKDIWPSCFLVAVTENGFAYDYLGEALLDAYGDDLTGREITEMLLYPHPPSLFATFQKVCTTAEPLTAESAFLNSHGATIRYRSSVLPFTSRGRTAVSFLLGGMRWKMF